NRCNVEAAGRASSFPSNWTASLSLMRSSGVPTRRKTIPHVPQGHAYSKTRLLLFVMCHYHREVSFSYSGPLVRHGSNATRPSPPGFGNSNSSIGIPSLCLPRILREQPVHIEALRREVLLLGELDHGLDVVAVRLESLDERVAAEERALLLDVGAREGEAQPVRLLHEVVVNILRLAERLVEASRHPRIAVENLLFDDDRMHDGKNFRFLVIALLFARVIREEALDRAFAREPAARQIGLDLGIGRQLGADELAVDAHPGDAVERQAVVVHQHALHHEGERVLVGADAEAPPAEIGGLVKSRGGADEAELVAEHAPAEKRERLEPIDAVAARGEIRAHRELARVVLA